MRLPKTPFTMAEFCDLNQLAALGRAHHVAVRKRFSELGLAQIRRRREKSYAELVWVKNAEIQDLTEFQEKLKDLVVV